MFFILFFFLVRNIVCSDKLGLKVGIRCQLLETKLKGRVLLPLVVLRKASV